MRIKTFLLSAGLSIALAMSPATVLAQNSGAAPQDQVFIDLTQKDPCWTPLQANFFMWTCASSAMPPEGREFALNIGVLVTENNIVFIDSGATAQVGRQVASEARSRFPGRSFFVINTQPKPEHVLGNIGIANELGNSLASTLKVAGRFVSGRQTSVLMGERCPVCIARFAERMGNGAVKGTETVVPGFVLSTVRGSLGVVDTELRDWRYELIKDIETEEVMLVNYPPGDLYWTGSAVQPTMVPDLYDGKLTSRLDYLAALQNKVKVTTRLAGSYGLLDNRWLRRNINYFTWLQTEVLLGMEKGVSEVELVEKLTQSVQSGVPNLKPREVETHQLNVQRVYRELEELLM